jgi:hypothetical protein
MPDPRCRVSSPVALRATGSPAPQSTRSCRASTATWSNGAPASAACRPAGSRGQPQFVDRAGARGVRVQGVGQSAGGGDHKGRSGGREPRQHADHPGRHGRVAAQAEAWSSPPEAAAAVPDR